MFMYPNLIPGSGPTQSKRLMGLMIQFLKRIEQVIASGLEKNGTTPLPPGYMPHDSGAWKQYIERIFRLSPGSPRTYFMRQTSDDCFLITSLHSLRESHVLEALVQDNLYYYPPESPGGARWIYEFPDGSRETITLGDLRGKKERKPYTKTVGDVGKSVNSKSDQTMNPLQHLDTPGLQSLMGEVACEVVRHTVEPGSDQSFHSLAIPEYDVESSTGIDPHGRRVIGYTRELLHDIENHIVRQSGIYYDMACMLASERLQFRVCAPIGYMILESAYLHHRDSGGFERQKGGGRESRNSGTVLRDFLGEEWQIGVFPTEKKHDKYLITRALEEISYSRNMVCTCGNNEDIMQYPYYWYRVGGKMVKFAFGHVYAIEGYDPIEETVRVANPWDVTEELIFPIEEFLDVFDYVTIAEKGRLPTSSPSYR